MCTNSDMWNFTLLFSLLCFVSTLGQKVETGKYRTGNYGTHLSLQFARIVVAFPMETKSHLNPTIFFSTLIEKSAWGYYQP